VCVVVLGKHVKGLEFLSTLMADTPPLTPDVAFYQRLLARDMTDALERIERHQSAQDRDTVYDALLLPALNYAERDRLEGRLSPAEEDTIIAATRELIADTGSPAAAPKEPARLSVLAYPVGGDADAVALGMLGRLIESDGVDMEIAPTTLLSPDLITAIRQHACRVICLADLPPSPPSKTRYLVKKLSTAFPELTIVVGRWAPESLRDDNPKLLSDAGATHVATGLVETRDILRQLIPVTSTDLSETDQDSAAK
jgi:hypothetical protein